MVWYKWDERTQLHLMNILVIFIVNGFGKASGCISQMKGHFTVWLRIIAPPSYELMHPTDMNEYVKQY